MIFVLGLPNGRYVRIYHNPLLWNPSCFDHFKTVWEHEIYIFKQQIFNSGLGWSISGTTLMDAKVVTLIVNVTVWKEGYSTNIKCWKYFSESKLRIFILDTQDRGEYVEYINFTKNCVTFLLLNPLILHPITHLIKLMKITLISFYWLTLPYWRLMRWLIFF